MNLNNYDSVKTNSTKYDWYYITNTDTINSNKGKGLNYIFIDVSHLFKYGINLNELPQINPYFISKLIKTKNIANKLFKGYQYVIWMDASIKITMNFDVKVKQLTSYNYDLYIYRHYLNENIYEEYKLASPLAKYYNFNNNMYEGVNHYIKNGTSNGLYETGFIIYKNVPSVHKFTNDWFEEIKKYGNECQLSFPTAINNNKNLSIFNLNTLSSVKGQQLGSVWNNDMFQVIHHTDKSYPRYDINNKINYIDKILWINLDRSENRFNKMTEMLSKINIPSERVSAVDGQQLHKYSYKIDMQNNNMSGNEIACTLSHIKAILSLTNVKGEYFLICEDDIIIENVYMFKHDLKHIISKCPSFDILMLYKTFIDDSLNETYTKWNDQNIKPGGTVAYVISRQGVNKFAKYNKIINNEIYTTNPFSVADNYIYKDLSTYIYKYNYIITSPFAKSTIHNHSDIHLLVENMNNMDMQFKYLNEDDIHT